MTSIAKLEKVSMEKLLEINDEMIKLGKMAQKVKEHVDVIGLVKIHCSEKHLESAEEDDDDEDTEEEEDDDDDTHDVDESEGVEEDEGSDEEGSMEVEVPLEDKTRDELIEIAQRMQLPGRESARRIGREALLSLIRRYRAL